MRASIRSGKGSVPARFALPLLILGAIGISFAPIFVRLSEAGPVATAMWRMGLSIPVLLLWTAAVRVRGGHFRAPAGWRDRLRLTLAGVFFAADLACWHIALNMTSVANGTLIANFSPVFVTLGAWLFFGDRFRGLFLAGLAAAIAGGVLLSLGGRSITAGPALTGDFLALLTALFYAAYMLTIGSLRRDFRTTTIMIYTAGVAAVLLLPLAIVMGERLLPTGLAGWSVVIGLALVSQVFGQVMVAYGLARLHPSFSAVGLLLAPAGSALWAWLLLAEPMTAMQISGGALALTGIYLAHQGRIRAPIGPARRAP